METAASFEARFAPWSYPTGLSGHKFEAVVAALHDANIPNRARCGADTGAAYIFNLRGRRLLKGMKKNVVASLCVRSGL